MAAPPACSPSTSGLQTRPDSGSSLDTRQGPWGRALLCFIKKKPIEARCPMCAVTGSVSGGQRGERERAPAPGSCCLSGGPALLPASPRPLTATLKGRYSQPRVTREAVGGGRAQLPEQGRAPGTPGRQSQARGACQADSCRAPT